MTKLRKSRIPNCPVDVKIGSPWNGFEIYMERDCDDIPPETLAEMDAIIAKLKAEIRSTWTPQREAEASGRLNLGGRRKINSQTKKSIYEHDGRLFQFAEPVVYSFTQPPSIEPHDLFND